MARSGRRPRRVPALAQTDRRRGEPLSRRRSAAATAARRCGRSPGWSHLGCDHAGPRLSGPWMARQP